ncbi:DNA replication/repair protein RecF [Alkaliphilus hydrothermalis]|uniref:DNA replication and repair protein RecF n=1 Tax=Alkaliphilus hydrothermalis TaxID=1482730 RepID=A0ABS2NRM7_9FIRM|nr:DNA replication/repair protein RecF [Alkaliphilus hydrothermalis]MBM7615595.1 DNA replication and repair protein RecF [Alkaliphilus hydrothermalis]
MFIEEVKAVNFRNYQELYLQLHPRLNIFVGENAQGKTNIIEMLYLSAMGKSFRTNKDQELIKFGKNQAYTKVNVKRLSGETLIEVRLDTTQKKKLKVNQIPLTKLGELLGNLNVVIFAPDDLKIVKGGPGERRRFIDNEICQIYPKYYYTLNQYNRILQQRNKLLKESRGRKIDLEIWNQQLAEAGATIITYRKKFIKRMGILAKLMHRKITEEVETLEIQYDSNVPFKEKDEFKEIVDTFLKKIGENSSMEYRRGLTLVGPHRDELVFKVNNIDVKNYGSQGQQRTAALSVKLAELELIKGEVGEYPVLLLDDVMSELDIKRQNYLINNLKNVQTFITTTMISQLNTANTENRRVFYVSQGEVRKCD